MRWEHSVSLEWLRARQKYITASEIKKLLPFTPASGRARPTSVQQANLLDVWAEKQVKKIQDDCISVGAAARGHILEPYAIAEFNELGYDQLYQWDDALIHNNNGLAFSPDALSAEQLFPAVEYSIEGLDISVIGEVKSYSAAKHYACGTGNKMKLEERYQIATAMAVMDTLERAWLMFYNPDCNHRLFIHGYTRDELAEEIEQCLECYNNITPKAAILASEAEKANVGEKTYDSLYIFKEVEQANLLNP